MKELVLRGRLRRVTGEGLATHRVDIFQISGSSVRVHFRTQAPWNGRSGWVEIDSSTGGFVQGAK